MLKRFIKHPPRQCKALVHFISETVYGSPGSRAESSKSTKDNFWRQARLMGAYLLPCFFVSVCMHAFHACAVEARGDAGFLSSGSEIESLSETSASCFF